MKNQIRMILLAMLLGALAFGGCKSEKSSFDPLGLLTLLGGPPTYTYYVDASAGSDTSYDGKTPSTAFKTITHAVAVAGVGRTINVAPGMYNVANGETFPITLKEEQYLIGDVVNKGQGTTTTEIKCTNSTASNFPPSVPGDSCLILSNNNVVRGFIFGNTVSQNFVSGVYSGVGLNVVVSDNSFDGMLYCGIYFHSGNLTSENNDFYNFSYSYYLDNPATSPVLINNNTIRQYASLPVAINNGSSNMVISNNTITGSGQIGVIVFGGSPIIQNNTFNRTAGYSDGAIKCVHGTPKIRSNTFSCANGIKIGESASNTGNPDMGTASDLGNNNFTAVTSYAIQINSGTATVFQAIGNTWPSGHNPPTTSDIDITVTGKTVWYGTGVSDFISNP